MWDHQRYLISLAHHGVKGQKWGVRNGPPYPIERDSERQTVSLKIAAGNGVLITGISSHATEQAKSRGVKNEDIVDAVQHPLYIRDIGVDDQGRNSMRYIGNNATVNVNPDTGVIVTVWPTGTRYKNKYGKGESGG